MLLRAVRTLAMLGTLVTGGCSGAVDPVTLGVGGNGPEFPGTPTEIYTRVARGAMGCWFGREGPLVQTHIFHGDVAPEAAGGSAEIVLHERDPSAPSPRGLRAFRIRIGQSPGGTAVVTENLKMPELVAARLSADVRRWAAGGLGCGPDASRWAPADGTDASAAPAKGR